MNTRRWAAIAVGMGLLTPLSLLAEHARTDGGDDTDVRVSPDRIAPPSLRLPYAPSPLRDEVAEPPKRRAPPVKNVEARLPERTERKAPETPVAEPEPAPVPQQVAEPAPPAAPETRVATVPDADRAAAPMPKQDEIFNYDAMIERAVQRTKFTDENGHRIFDQCSEEDPEVKRHPLLLFAARGNDRKVGSLLDGGSNINQRRGTKKRTALICAIENRRESTVALLLNRGANPHLPNFHGTNPVAFAAVENSPAMVRMLMDRGANPKKPNGAGYNAFFYASERKDIIAMLQKR